jgi:ATP-dependent Clp protease protease subunit
MVNLSKNLLLLSFLYWKKSSYLLIDLFFRAQYTYPMKFDNQLIDKGISSNLWLSTRQIYFHDDIESKTISELVSKITVLQRISKEPIRIFVNSPGGFVYDSFSAYDFIKDASKKNQIEMVATGLVASAATMIFLASPIRLAHRTSSFMFHDITAGVEGNATQIKMEAAEVERLRLLYRDVLFKNTKIKKRMFEQMMKYDTYLNVRQCVKLGVVNGII